MDGEVDGLVTSSKRGGGGREINPPAYTCILPVRPSLLIQVEEDPRLTTPVQDAVLQLARTAEGRADLEFGVVKRYRIKEGGQSTHS